MNIQIKWANINRSVLIYRFPKQWDWDDFEAAIEIGFGLIEAESHHVNTIFDLTRCQNIPEGVLLYWGKMMKILPPNHDKIAFVTGNEMATTAVKMFRDINKRSASKIINTQDLSAMLEKFMKDDPNNKTILVIEDEDALREELVELLRLEGYQVLEASNGLSGLQMARVNSPSLIVSDISMPQMDGFTLLDELRKHPLTEQTPMIFLTARADRSFVRHGMELGADDYITKPFTSKEITSAIQSRLLRLKSLQNSL